MAKQSTQSAKLTQELPGITRPRGRPSTGKAMTPAQRQAKRRARVAAARMNLTSTAEEMLGNYTLEQLRDMLVVDDQVFQGVWVEIGRRYGWLK